MDVNVVEPEKTTTRSDSSEHGTDVYRPHARTYDENQHVSLFNVFVVFFLLSKSSRRMDQHLT